MKVTSTEIKNKFGEYLRLCANEPVYITKNGKTIAKLLNHNQRDDIIEDSVNLRKVYHVDDYHYRDYKPDAVAESAAAYNVKPFEMSLEEFHEMNRDATQRYEYIDGQVYVLASPTFHHQQIISWLLTAFALHLKDKPCQAFTSPFDVTLLRRKDELFTNIVQPDLLIVCDGESNLDEKGKYMGIPRLVVEVLSPSNSVKEMITKFDLYRDSGVEEYWIIDQKSRQVLIYKFEDYCVSGTAVYSGEDVCRSFIYEAFEIAMGDLIPRG